jgi:hypothetical protein
VILDDLYLFTARALFALGALGACAALVARIRRGSW